MRARVAGITVPAFVERRIPARRRRIPRYVSPGLRSRPSLSALSAALWQRANKVVSPGLRSRPSLSGRCR